MSRLRALGSVYDLEFHGLPLIERLEALHLDGAIVGKDVSPIFRGDEPIALRCVEPLNRSLHWLASLRQYYLPARGRLNQRVEYSIIKMWSQSTRIAISPEGLLVIYTADLL